MKIINIETWAVPPETGTTFRIGNDMYYCHLKIWHYALIQYVDRL